MQRKGKLLRRSARWPGAEGVMCARSASLAAAHVIGPDANEVLKARRREGTTKKRGVKEERDRSGEGGMGRQLGVRAEERK